MDYLKLKEDFYWIGTRDYGLKTFDIIMTTEYGSTYNSYLLEGSEAVAIFDTTKIAFAQDFIDTIEQLIPVEKVKYLIISHTEPDHTGMISELLKVHPDIIIVGTQIAINFLKEMVNQEFNSMPVKTGDEISLGDKTLQFAALPQLHWPDTMYTYIPEIKTVVTCDSFGAHYCSEKMLLSEILDKTDYNDALKYYFDVIIAPFKTFMQKGIQFVNEHDIDMIAVGHGPIIDSDIPELIKKYSEWSTVAIRKDKVVIGYVSAYGFTKIMAKTIENVLQENGLETMLFDLEVDDHNLITAQLDDAKGLLLGSPTILADAVFPVYDFLSKLYPITHHFLKSSAFGSYGWSGEAAPNMVARMQQLRMKTSDGFRAKFKPSETDLENLKVWATEYAQRVKA